MQYTAAKHPYDYIYKQSYLQMKRNCMSQKKN